MVIKSYKIPSPGETILGGKFFMNPGRKGANQAVSAARLGGNVTFVAKIGDDIFGKQSKQTFENEKINIDNLFLDLDNPSGIALITVDSKAENCIVVAPGSNGKLNKLDIDNAKKSILESEILLMQLEIPIETVLYAAQMASAAGKKIILNPAPATMLPDELFKMLYILTPNETEASFLSGIEVIDQETAEKVALIIRGKKTPVVIITMGSKGALICTDKGAELIPAPNIKAIDTTAAGDVFNGALAVALSEGLDLVKSVEFANKAATISVTRLGAQSSAPYRNELSEL